MHNHSDVVSHIVTPTFYESAVFPFIFALQEQSASVFYGVISSESSGLFFASSNASSYRFSIISVRCD